MRAKDGVGRYGEEVAVRHLEATGHRVLARNWRCKEGELDAVVVDPDGRTLVFVEVKTRSSRDFGEPAEAVGPRKRSTLRLLAGRWLGEAPPGLRWDTIRFDVVSVLRQPRGAASVQHLRGVI